MALEDESYPAHASPDFPPIHSPQTRPPQSRQLSEFRDEPPPSFLSPAITPPATPGSGTPAILRDAKSVPVDTSISAVVDSAINSNSTSSIPLERITTAARLLPPLPTVRCEVRARIPTTSGQQMFLYLYTNDADSKEHLAIVFGEHIRSASLDTPRPGETERDRMIRGAYVGRLHPGRTSSRVTQLKQEHGVTNSHTLSAQPETTTTTTTDSTTDMDGEQEHHNEELSTEAAKQQQRHEEQRQAPLVRIHSECYTGETVWSARCDCGEQLDEAQRLMCLAPNQAAGGVIIYLRQEGRGIGLGEKLKAYNLQDLGHDTYEANLLLRHPADARSYGLATAMLVDLGLGGSRGIRLLTNNPDKIRAVEGPQRQVVVRERVAMIPLAWSTGGSRGVKGQEVEAYLSTKIDKFKHMLDHK